MMLRLLDVSSSGYYDWRNRPPSQRVQNDVALDEEIKEVTQKGRNTYGAQKIMMELRKQNKNYGEKRIRKRMKINNILVKRIRKKKRTTIADPANEVTENILNREFDVDSRDTVWVGDITYIQTVTGWCYLAIVMDLYSRKVVGWALSTTMETELVMKAFDKAYRERNPHSGLLFHSDRGVQYTSKMFRDNLVKKGVIHSMSRKGNCWDNAVIESFNGVLKLEWLYSLSSMPKNLSEVELAVFDYIEIFYNRIRIHSTLGYYSPEEFEYLEIKKQA